MAINPFGKWRHAALLICAGDLRHSVTIEQPVYAPDARGLAVTPSAWTPVRTAMAAIYTAGGDETSSAAQIVSRVSRVVKVRWTSDVIKANYRVVFGGQFYTIAYVENVLERNRVLLLYCQEIDGGGE